MENVPEIYAEIFCRPSRDLLSQLNTRKSRSQPEGWKMEVKASISPLHKEIEQEVSQDGAIVRESVVIKVQGGCHQVVPRTYAL